MERLSPYGLPNGREIEAIVRAKHKKFKKNNPYVALLEGQSVLRSNIALFVPYVLGALEILIRAGKIVEQPMLFPERPDDSMLYRS